jgi:hypothetical protein
MEIVEDNGKTYEIISVKKSKEYTRILDAIEIIKEFIKSRKLIIYGGTAIDYALRLHGDHIYSDDQLQVPDLDMYSNNSIDDAYDLADILYKKGFENVRAIRAVYVRTTRVDLGGNNFLADISYIPPGIDLPTLNYEGMAIIHPDYQKLDMHWALSFPLSSAPNEAIFTRAKKDIERYNKLNKYFHVGSGLKTKGNALELKPVKISLNYMKYVFTGFSAYSIICKIMNEKHAVSFDDNMKYYSIENSCEIVHTNPIEVIKSHELKDSECYSKYINLLPMRYVAKDTVNGIDIIIHNIHNKRIAAHTVTIGSHKLKITNVSYILLMFLAGAYLSSGDKSITYIELYKHVLKMIEKSNGKHEFLMPTYKTYGKDNISESDMINIRRIHVDLGLAKPYNMPPTPYLPKTNKRPDPYDFNETFFQIDGRKLGCGNSN